MSAETARRVNEIIAALLQRRLELSLAQVEQAIAAWRRGETDASDAHHETLKHGQRAQVLGARVARAGVEGPNALLRDALDLGLVDEAEFRTLTGRDPADVPPLPAPDDVEAGEASGGASFLPPKRDVVEKLLEDGPVLLHLDARHASVDVPDQHRADPRLILRIGWDLSPPIPDLTFDEHGVRATLTFRGRPFTCKIPWDAIYAVVAEDGRGLVWPEHVPPDVAEQFESELRGQRPGRGASSASGGGRVGPARAPTQPGVGSAGGSGGQGGASGATGEEPPTSPDKPKRPHLRLV
jgi:stringent starvation protein B